MNKYVYLFTLIVIISTRCSSSNDSLLFLPSLISEAAESDFQFTRTDFFYPASERNRIPDRIVSLIDGSRESLDLWVYGFSDSRLIESLRRARDRGVRISITGSPDEDYTKLHQAGFYPAIRARTGIQHSKIILIDDYFLISGTGNFTKSGMNHNENLFLFLNTGRQTGTEVKKALSSEYDTDPFIHLPWNGKMFFSPEHGRLIQRIITEEILKARYRIRFMIFSHTDPVITAALMLAVRKGITVEGIYDDPSGNGRISPDSQAEYLMHEISRSADFSALYLEGNRNEYTDENGVTHGGKMHHKTVIIDDHTVLTGSFNWSQSARDSNREVFYLFRDPGAASVFAAEFERQLVLSRQADRISTPGRELSAGGAEDFLFKPETGEVCLRNPEEGIPEKAVYFSGNSAWFSPRVYSDFSKEGCVPFENHLPVSGGIVTGKSWLVPPDAFTDTASGKTNHPCTQENPCRWIQTLYYSGESGHLETEEKENLYKYLSVWNRKGITEKIPLNYHGAGFYTFPEFTYSGGDSLLFLEAHSGGISASCAFKEKTEEQALRNFLLYLRYKGVNPPCNF